MSLLSDLQEKFQGSVSEETTPGCSYACVAILLRGKSLETLEVAYIRRALRNEDRWSHQVAFPGGKKENSDANTLAAAIREVHEEIGVHLNASELIGQLQDIQATQRGKLLDFYIRPFVFFIHRDLELDLSPAEVIDFFWLGMSDLQSPGKQIQHRFEFEGKAMILPAIDVGSEPPLWGLTYRMTQTLLSLLVEIKKP